MMDYNRMPASTGPLDPRGFYENQQGVVAPIQTVFNGGKRKSKKTRKTRKNRKAHRKTRRTHRKH
jgi:hypothetical protein